MVDVILVDEKDNPIGTQEKMQAHKEGNLHRCFSIVIYNDKKEMIIHKRASNKYHCGGLWTNACCSHQAPNEETIAAAKRRLQEELGYEYEDVTLKPAFEFIYKASFENGLTEHEYDHVLIGTSNKDPPKIDPSEIEKWKWVSIKDLKEDIDRNPDKYTIWFKLILDKLD